jgi:hypothetical protein
VKKNLSFLGFGMLFGFALSRVRASDYNYIYNMFTGTDLTLALVIVSAIIVGAVGMRLLAMNHYRGYQGQPIEVNKKELTKYTALGGTIFGIGWGMSGACPGTLMAQIGEGSLMGLVTLTGAILGTYAYAMLKEKVKDL